MSRPHYSDTLRRESLNRGVYMGTNNKPGDSEIHKFLLWLKQVFRDKKWILLFILAIGFFLLGYKGFSDASMERNETLSSSDLAYLSLQLFQFKEGEHYLSPPLTLDIARFLSPTLTATALLLLLITFFFHEIRLFSLKYLKKNHAVICGMGYVGSAIAPYLLEKGIPVVIIEKDRDNEALAACREQGALIIVGDASHEYYLRKAVIERARCLFTASGDDETNTRIALTAQSILGQSSGAFREEPLTCYIHLEDPRLTRLLKVEEFAAVEENIIRFEFFNIYHNAALCLIDNTPVFCRPLAPAEAPHFLIIGVGRMGESLIVHMVRRWKELFFDMAGKKVQITFIDREAGRKFQTITKRNPSLLKYCDLVHLEMDTKSPDFMEGRFLYDSSGQVKVTGIYICISDQTQAFISALFLRRKLSKTGIPIVVRTEWSEGFSRFFGSVSKKSGEFENLTTFPIVSCDCCIEKIIHGTHEVIARSIHDGYVLSELKKIPPGKGPFICPWNDLEDHIKKDNRLQADDIWRKLKLVDCGVEELTSWDEPLFTFTDKEIEFLAEKEHERWMHGKIREGYRFGPERDEANRIHNLLVPWDDPRLPDDAREKDRDIIRMIPANLARVDLKVVRLEKR